MIKLINYGRYASREVFISKTMIHSMECKDDITNITMDGGGEVMPSKKLPKKSLQCPTSRKATRSLIGSKEDMR